MMFHKSYIMYKFISQFMTMFLLISQVLVWISEAMMTHFSYEIMRKMVATKWGGLVEHQPAIPCLSTDIFRKYPTGRSVLFGN